MIANHNLKLFKENLGEISDFRTDERYYTPILDPKLNSNITSDLKFFQNNDEPFIVNEEDFDPINKTIVRCIRRSPLVMREDWKRDIMRIPLNQNNRNVKRGFHISVRDFNNSLKEVGTQKYSMHADNPQVLWFRPSDYLHPNYDELKEN